jgi:hypothetical protein
MATLENSTRKFSAAQSRITRLGKISGVLAMKNRSFATRSCQWCMSTIRSANDSIDRMHASRRTHMRACDHADRDATSLSHFIAMTRNAILENDECAIMRDIVVGMIRIF